MATSESGGDCGLTLRWVEATDALGRSRMEMRWAAETAGSRVPVLPTEASPATVVPPGPPVAPHAA